MRKLRMNSSADQLFSKEGNSNQLRWAGSKVSHWIILCIPVQYFGERGWVQQRPFPIRDTHAAFPTRSILVNKESASVAVLQTEDLFFSFSRDLWSNLYIPVQYFGERDELNKGHSRLGKRMQRSQLVRYSWIKKALGLQAKDYPRK